MFIVKLNLVLIPLGFAIYENSGLGWLVFVTGLALGILIDENDARSRADLRTLAIELLRQIEQTKAMAEVVDEANDRTRHIWANTVTIKGAVSDEWGQPKR